MGEGHSGGVALLWHMNGAPYSKTKEFIETRGSMISEKSMSFVKMLKMFH